MSTLRDSGGQVFPHIDSTDPAFRPGMTLRDYFIAQAPAEPQPWFQPLMPPAPAVPTFHQAEDEVKLELKSADYEDFIDPAHMTQAAREWHDKRMAALNALRAHKAEREKQRYVQWPAAWADEMLKQRAK